MAQSLLKESKDPRTRMALAEDGTSYGVNGCVFGRGKEAVELRYTEY